MIMAWLPRAPISVTTPPAGTNSGVQAGSVLAVTRMSPGSRAKGSDGSRMMRARPRATPPEPAVPDSTVPAAAAWTVDAPRRVHASSGTGRVDDHEGRLEIEEGHEVLLPLPQRRR